MAMKNGCLGGPKAHLASVNWLLRVLSRGPSPVKNDILSYFELAITTPIRLVTSVTLMMPLPSTSALASLIVE